MERNVKIYLTAEQEKFISWLADYDNANYKEADTGTSWTAEKELSAIAKIGIDNMMEDYARNGIYKKG